jgi:hypothetical protein
VVSSQVESGDPKRRLFSSVFNRTGFLFCFPAFLLQKLELELEILDQVPMDDARGPKSCSREKVAPGPSTSTSSPGAQKLGKMGLWGVLIGDLTKVGLQFQVQVQSSVSLQYRI